MGGLDLEALASLTAPLDNEGMSEKVDELKNRIRELESELADRENDLHVYQDQLKGANQRLAHLIALVQQELETASQIQRLLVPTEFPHIPGFEFSSKFIPSLKSGGDYFDIFEHEDKLRFGLILASSSGYAMSALLLSVFLKMTGQIEARRGKNPELVMQDMMDEIQKGMSETDEASLFYGVFDRRRYELHYVSIGSVVGLHYSYHDKKLTKLKSEILPLKSAQKPVLVAHTVSLNPRDRIVMCTPGLVQLSDHRGEPFGLEKLSQIVMKNSHASVHDLRNEIFFQAHQYAQSDEFPKDLSVIVTEVKDRVIKLAKSSDE